MGLMAILFVSLAMAGFGLDMFLTGNEREAITVNGRSVPYVEYYQELRQTNERYVQMFGARFNELARTFNLNVPQQVVDQMINGLLIEEQAESLGLAVGEKELKDFLNRSFEGDTSKYVNFLRNSGMTAPQFEAKARRDLLRQQYSSLLTLASFASKREAEAMLRREESKVDVEYVEVSADSVKDKVPTPDDATLKSFFENNMTDFQSPATVSYSYLALGPNDVLGDVVLTDEDLAFYMSEHEAQFSTPERAKIRHIELLNQKDATEEQRRQLRDRAEALLKRAREKESFEDLVMEASDDITTKMLGGDLGWLERSSAEPAVVEKVFALKGTGVADLIATPGGFRIIKVEEYQPAKLKDLAEVRTEVEGLVRAQEAPAYAMARAQQLYADLQSGKTTLEAVAASYKNTVGTMDAPAVAGVDPGSDYKGLTAKVLEQPDQTVQLHDLGDRAVFVVVQKYNQPVLPAFEAVREKIVDLLKDKESAQAARTLAQEISGRLEKGEALSAVAASAGLTVQKKEDIGRKSELTGTLGDPRFSKELFASPSPGKVLPSVYKAGNASVVAVVSKVVAPDESLIKEKLAGYQEQASTAIGTEMTTSLLNHLKSIGKVDFDQSILTN